MPGIALFVVRATIQGDHEAAFNAWYNDEHVPLFLRFPGAVSARRYRAVIGESKYQYMAVYELVDEAALRRFLQSEHGQNMKAEYDRHFGEVSERVPAGYVQVWP